MRHNKIPDLEAELMKEVCHDVQLEPALILVEEDNIYNVEDDRKRPDVAVRERDRARKHFSIS